MIACQLGKADYVKHFIGQGTIDLTKPPDKLDDDPTYIKTPFIIAAVASGSRECVLALIKANPNCLKESGFICLSPVERNLVTSNIVGCAAWHGNAEMLSQIIKAKDVDMEFPATEKKFLKSELQRCTPLSPAVANGHMRCANILVQALVSNGKKPDLMAAIEQGQNHKEL